MLNKFIPHMYKKSVFTIDYNYLKRQGIKTILFDLDNTLCLIDEDLPSREVKDLLTKLGKDFKVIIVSNSGKKRLSLFCDNLNIKYIYSSFKPLTKGFKKVLHLTDSKKDEIIMIGDQLFTDILGAKRFGFNTMLVDPLSLKDKKITFFNRYMEKLVLNKLEKKNKFQKGKYYE